MHQPGEESAAGIGQVSGRRTILLVEDDQQVCDVTRALLTSWGYEVLCAGNEQEARDLWRRHRSGIRLLVADLMIPPRSTGARLADQFREEEPSLQVILTSGFGPEIADDDAELRTGFTFLQKPVPPDQLRAMVRELMGS